MIINAVTKHVLQVEADAGRERYTTAESELAASQAALSEAQRAADIQQLEAEAQRLAASKQLAAVEASLCDSTVELKHTGDKLADTEYKCVVGVEGCGQVVD
jgi:hypothetical protein